MFKDLLKDIEIKDINKKHIKYMNDCAIKNFFPNPLFDVK